jgi:hypothetical protein
MRRSRSESSLSVFTIIVGVPNIFEVEVVNFALLIHEVLLILVLDLDLAILLALVLYYALVFLVVAALLVVLQYLGHSGHSPASLISHEYLILFLQTQTCDFSP